MGVVIQWCLNSKEFIFERRQERLKSSFKILFFIPFEATQTPLTSLQLIRQLKLKNYNKDLSVFIDPFENVFWQTEWKAFNNSI